MKEALVVFAKAPVAGQVKTRLIGALTAEQARDLYICFLRDTFALLESVQDERENLSLVLCYTPADDIEAFEAADLNGCLMLSQQGEDLGQRLNQCFSDLFTTGFNSVVIIGSDSPTLPEEIIHNAYEALLSDDVVVGPTEDGGYYLIGLRAPQPKLFADIDWSSANVLAQTIAAGQRANLQVTQMPSWFDVDTPADLEKLKAQIFTDEADSTFTKRFLKRFK